MINIQKTIEKFGYNPNDLKPRSSKIVLVDCDYCGKEISPSMNTVYGGRKHIKKDCCKNCQGEKQKDLYPLVTQKIMFNGFIKRSIL